MNNSDYIKYNTQTFHSEIEELMNSNQIFENDYDLGDYIGMLIVHLQLLETLECSVHSEIEKAWPNQLSIEHRRKIQVLEKELLSLGYQSDIQSQEHLNIDSPFQALGMLYVMEGSTLGGNVIKKTLQKNTPFADQNFDYFSFYGAEISKFWKELVDFINKFPHQKEEILTGAKNAYHALLTIAKKLKTQEAVT